MEIVPQHPLLSCPTPVAGQPICSLVSQTDFSLRPNLLRHIENELERSPQQIIWGGYLETRDIYSSSDSFVQNGSPRNIHLGIDIWTHAFTPIYAPINGVIHSLHDNKGFSNYGPTIILEHYQNGEKFHTLYGHLSRASLIGKNVGERIKAGDTLCELGVWEENGEWPPHLHFQVVVDMGEWQGDYPGACTVEDLPYYSRNCPDPLCFLEI